LIRKKNPRESEVAVLFITGKYKNPYVAANLHPQN
jgi:hypothetical protein